MPTPSDLYLARLAVQRGLTTDERVRECLDLQRRGRRIGLDAPLSSVLVQRGYLREDDQRALDRDLALWRFLRSEQRFLRRLVERGALTKDDARALLGQARQEGFRARVGDALVERGRLDRALREAVAREVVGDDEAEERAAREADAQGDGAPPPPPPDEVEPPPAVQPRALLSLERDQRRFGQPGRDGAGLPPGAAVEGFELLERLGQGPHGVVFRARHVARNEVVAVKVLAPALVGAPTFLATFRRSWAQALGLEHPGLVRLGAPGRSGELAYFTMEHVDGDALGALVERGGPLPADRVTALLRGVLQALDRAHQAGVVHGALAPSNVLVRRGSGAPVVTDLALAGVSGPGPSAALYASPQRLTAAAPPGPADDVYAVGALAYLLLVGRAPFADASATSRLGAAAPDPREADPKADAGLATFIEACTRPDAAERPVDAGAALVVLERGVAAAVRGRAAAPTMAAPPLPAPPLPAPPPPPRPPAPPGARPGSGATAGLTPSGGYARPTAPPSPPRPPTPRPATPAGALDAVVTPRAEDELRGGDRTVAIPAGVAPLPLPGAPPAPPPADDIPPDSPLLRTIELPPLVPPAARVEDSGVTPVVIPGAPPKPDARDAVDTIVAMSDADLAAVERTIVTAPPPELLAAPPPPADDGEAIERTILTPPPGVFVGSAALGVTQPMAPLAAAGLGVTQPMAPLAGAGLGVTQPVERPVLPPPPRPPAGVKATKGHPAAVEPRFDAMGETMPMAPLRAGGGPPPGDDLVGQVVHNRYKIIAKLGQGGMGVVYKAEHTLMGRQVAFKVLNPDLVKSAESVARFKREILAMAQFQHRNVVRIFDAGVTDGGRCYMAMELVDGKSLADVLAQEGPTPLDRFARLFAQILRGLAEGHRRGIVHRDLKAENIYVVQEGGDEVVKIMDFGIAKLLWADTSPQSLSNQFLTTERMAVGTPEYMSPEQASGGAKIDARSDLYSLGVVAYEMLTGKLPFDADSPVGFIGKHIIDPPIPFAERAPERGLPATLEGYVLRALEKDPEARWPSAEAMLVGLEQALPEQVAALRATSRWPGQASSVAASAGVLPSPPSAALAAAPRAAELGATAPASSEGPGPAPSGEASGEGAPAPAAPGGRVLLVVFVALLAVALVLVLAIAFVAWRKRPSAERIAQLVSAREPEVSKALGEARWADARRALEGVAPAELPPGAPERKAVDDGLRRVAEAEAAHGALLAAQGEAAAASAEVEAKVEAEDLAAAEGAVERARGAAGRQAAARARLEALQLGALAPPAAVDLAALEGRLAPLREVQRRVAEVDGLLRQTPPELDGAADRLRALVAGARAGGARRAALERQLADVEARLALAQALQELGKQDADLAKVLDKLRAAQRAAPSTEVADRIREVEGRQARAEVQGLVAEADAALARDDPAAAVDALDRARRRAGAAGLQDAWGLDARRTAATAEVRARAAYDQLPAVPTAGAAPSQVAAASDARRAFLAAHPRTRCAERVARELDAILALAPGTGPTPGTGPPPGTGPTPGPGPVAGSADADELLRQASVALGRRAWGEVAALTSAARAKLPRGDPRIAKAYARDELAEKAAEDWVVVGRLLVGKLEVTTKDLWTFRRARDPKTPAFRSGFLPAGDVTFLEARAYCEWLSDQLGLTVRLPTEEEWVRFATGGDGRRYPWGPTWDPARAVWGRAEKDGPLPRSAPGFDGEAGASPAGVWHLSGNLAEWVDTPWPDEEEGPDTSARILKGGSFRSFAPDALTTTARVKGGTGQKKPEWGFRVVIELAE